MSLPKISHPINTYTLPLSGQKVNCRPWLVREEKILLMAKQSAKPEDILLAIRQVVNNCVETEGFDIDKLSILDLEWLFIQIRSNSVSNIVTVTYRDNEDKEQYKFDIDLGKIEIIRPEPVDPFYDLGNGLSLTLKFPSASLYSDSLMLDPENPSLTELLITKFIAEIHELGPLGDIAHDPALEKPEDLITFVNNLDVKAMSYIKSFMDSTPRLDYKVTWTNKNGTKREESLSSLDDFFTFR